MIIVRVVTTITITTHHFQHDHHHYTHTIIRQNQSRQNDSPLMLNAERFSFNAEHRLLACLQPKVKFMVRIIKRVDNYDSWHMW